jgi:ORF6N domain
MCLAYIAAHAPAWLAATTQRVNIISCTCLEVIDSFCGHGCCEEGHKRQPSRPCALWRRLGRCVGILQWVAQKRVSAEYWSLYWEYTKPSNMPPNPAKLNIPALQSISLAITVLRGQRVILDTDLAALYGAETKRFNEAIKRNGARFPADFMFQLEVTEFESLRSQIATSNVGRGGRRYAPYVFTEHGAIMAAMVLNSPRAVEMSMYVVRAFVQLREAALQHKDLAQQLAQLQEQTQSLAMQHDTFSRNTRNQLMQVFDTLRDLVTPPDPHQRPIGFVHPQDAAKPKAQTLNASPAKKAVAKASVKTLRKK